MPRSLGSLRFLEGVALPAVPLQELISQVQDVHIATGHGRGLSLDLLHSDVLPPAGLGDLPQSLAFEVDRGRVDVVKSGGMTSQRHEEVRVEQGEERVCF